MSGHRPITRSRSKKFHPIGVDDFAADYANVPPPLNIRKANAPVAPARQRFDVTSIGLAVGSPSDSPLPPMPAQNQNYTDAFHFPPPSAGRSRADTDESGRERKSKGTKWKTFGGLFGKKDTRDTPSRGQEHPIYIADPTFQREWQYVPNKPKPVTRKRAGSDKEKGMELHNSLANKQIARGPSLLRRSSTRRKGVRRKVVTDTRIDVPGAQMNSSLQALKQNSPGRVHTQNNNLRDQPGNFSLLQVEIPDIQLERYSVMFGNVLQPGLGQFAASKTSLTKSRQGSVEDDKVILMKDSLLEPLKLERPPKPHQRDGSGSSTSSRSPSFSLFPSPQSSPGNNVINKPLPKPSPLSRSVTAPDVNSNLTLPPRPPIKSSKSQDPHQFVAVASGKENFPISKWSTTHSRQGSNTNMHTRTHSFDPSIRSRNSHSHVAKLSFDNSLHSAESHSKQPSFDPSVRSLSDTQGSFFDASEFFPPDQQESFLPASTSVGNPSAKSGNTKQAFLNRAFPTRKSSLKRTNTKDKSIAMDLGYAEAPKPPYANNGLSHASSDSVSSAAEVSIARQISISRKQRQLLVPVVAKTARQPVQPQVVDGVDGRKSELVFFDEV